MGKTEQQRQRTRKKAEQRRRKLKQRKQEQSQSEPTPKLQRKLEFAYDLVEQRKFSEAEKLLKSLADRYPNSTAVLETQLFYLQEAQDHEKASIVAKKLMVLDPSDPEALLMYAQASMFCNRACLAVTQYRRFLAQWPDHRHRSKAKTAIELSLPECNSRVTKAIRAGFLTEEIDDGGFERYAEHEESLERLHNGDFHGAIALCESLLGKCPDFVSARNNQATCYYQIGECEQAVKLARETNDRFPANRYAEALMIKLEFLTGNEERANEGADRLVVNPPDEQDPLVAALEALSFLGRDEDIVVLVEACDAEEFDPTYHASLLHYSAVAHFRLGDEEGARRLWGQALKILPTHPTARKNLDDLLSGQGHAPWAESFAKWIPQALLETVLNTGKHRGSNKGILSQYPAIAALVPALLDRGDPRGRECAMRMALADGSPEMLDALKRFALGCRGPDSLRRQAMADLRARGHQEKGPVRIYNNGQWQEVDFFSPKIYFERTGNVEDWESDLAEVANRALERGDLDLAEQNWSEILKKNPDSLSSRFNLATVWIRRNDDESVKLGEETIQAIFDEHPNYAFARIALANFAVADGDIDRASELLRPLMDRSELHVSEALALFAAKAQIAIKAKNLESAEICYKMLVEMVGAEHPTVAEIRSRIDHAGQRGLFRELLKSW